MSTEQYLVTAICCLATAVSFLFLWFKDRFAACEAREAKCQNDYVNLLARVIAFETRANMAEETKRNE